MVKSGKAIYVWRAIVYFVLLAVINVLAHGELGYYLSFVLPWWLASLLESGVYLGGVLALTWAFCRTWDKRPLAELGLRRRGWFAGTLVANADPETVDCYGEYGYRLGILAQGWNDLYGLSGSGGKKDDKQGSNLPLLAARSLADDGADPMPEDLQAGQLYALAQVQRFHQEAFKALNRCPAPGRLGGYLEHYAIARHLGIEPGDAGGEDAQTTER